MQIHGLGTIAGILMPALLPDCSTLYEVGAYTHDGDNVTNLMVDSPDGLIKLDHKVTGPCCNRHIYAMNNDDMSVELKSPYPQPDKIPVHYTVPRWYVLQILTHMFMTKTRLNLYGCCGPKSLVAIQCSFDAHLWQKLWSEIKEFLDQRKPAASQWPKHFAREFRDDLDSYIQTHTTLIGEVPIVTTDVNESEFRRSFRFNPYHQPKTQLPRIAFTLDEVRDMIHTNYLQAVKLLKDAYHIVREEASEIIAFVAADSTRVPEPGIPRHIPVAYGLKGHSLPMQMMRPMINDVRDECNAKNINVRCEIYDGQFLNLVRYSSDNSPLTKLTFLQEYYKEVKKWSKVRCLNHLITVVVPNEYPIDYSTSPRVLEMWKKSIEDLNKRRDNRPARPETPTLAPDDITHLLKGSQLGSRISRQVQDDGDDSDDGHSENDDEDDPDYIVNDSDLEVVYDDSDYSDDSEDLNEELDDIIADSQTDTEGPARQTTFLEDLLECLLDLSKGKVDWTEMDVDDLVNKFFKSPEECMKLVHDELNLIGNLIQTYTGVKVFNISDLKAVKINKLLGNLQTSSRELLTTSRKQRRQPRTVKTLKQLARIPVMQPIYSKEYLQIVVANTMFETAATNWFNNSPIPTNFNVDQEDGDFFEHQSHSYPEYSESRQQHEYRCIDPGHTLANMRSQISRYGYEFCRKEPFVKVSETNHKVLPKSILEDRLDRQSIRIAKRFFSNDVEKELTKNGDNQEAKFVRLVRHWFEACDERGIDVYTRVKHLDEFSNFLAEQIEWEEMPPPFGYIKGMPVPTYEAIMQGITTRLQIFQLSNMPINQRAISTIGIESFFSELTSMEFSGLGCPKAVDIPRLISHVAELNNIRHDTQRGFVFNTTNRGAYPYDAMEPPLDRNSTRFDQPRRRKQRKWQSLLALPKAVTRGQLTIREFHRKDESKVHLHKRAGVPASFDAMDPS